MVKKIVVVDDDEGILEALSIMLESEGYEVTATSNGDEVEKLVSAIHPDLVLLDVLLSGVDGREICQKLKTRASTKHISIIMFSAAPEMGKSVKKYLADDFIPKPFDIEELLAKMKKHLH